MAWELLLFELSTMTSAVGVGGGAGRFSSTPSLAAAVLVSTTKEDMKKQEVLLNHPCFDSRLENPKDEMQVSGIANGCGFGEG